MLSFSQLSLLDLRCNCTRAMSSQIYDVIVVGGGAIGLGAAYEVAKAGKSTLILEKSCLFNAAGSSNDLARMYRTM